MKVNFFFLKKKKKRKKKRQANRSDLALEITILYDYIGGRYCSQGHG
jgi:hypothetical protein